MDKNEWNNFIRKNGGSLLQSWEWGDFQKSEGKKILRVYDKDNLAASLILNPLVPFRDYLYCPRGPVFEQTTSPKQGLFDFIEEIKNLSEKDKIVFLRVEPEIKASEENVALMHGLGFRESISIQPKETILIDLKRDKEEIFYSMDKDLRYAVRTAKKRNVSVQVISRQDDKKEVFENFWNIFEQVNRRHGLRRHQKEYYQKLFELGASEESETLCHSVVFAGKVKDKIAAAALVVFWGRSAIYLHSASDLEYKHYNAPSLVLWEVISEAKRRNCDYFDLWGVSSTNKKWEGVSRFKERFGGKRIHLIGTWDYVFRPKLYTAYEMIRTLVRR